MDPNEALRQLRLLAKQMWVDESPSVRKQHANDLADQFAALDEWLSSGNFLPGAWQRADDFFPRSRIVAMLERSENRLSELESVPRPDREAIWREAVRKSALQELLERAGS